MAAVLWWLAKHGARLIGALLVRRSAKAEAGSRGLTNVEFFNAGLDEERMPQEPTYQARRWGTGHIGRPQSGQQLSPPAPFQTSVSGCLNWG